MRRSSAAPGAPTIPGTAVKPRRRTADEITAALSRSVPQVPDQGDLVDHWHEVGLLNDGEVNALGGEQP